MLVKGFQIKVNLHKMRTHPWQYYICLQREQLVHPFHFQSVPGAQLLVCVVQLTVAYYTGMSSLKVSIAGKIFWKSNAISENQLPMFFFQEGDKFFQVIFSKLNTLWEDISFGLICVDTFMNSPETMNDFVDVTMIFHQFVDNLFFCVSLHCLQTTLYFTAGWPVKCCMINICNVQ